jgi:phosphoribosylamine--glycine ligase
VAVCGDEASANEFLDEVFTKRAFGEGDLIVEECLTGPEVSIFASICEGSYHILMPARDYKRVGDNDEGPNTGGMGAVASRQLVSPELMEEIEKTIVKPTVEGLLKDELHYRGFLYFGLMLTPQGPQVLEFNCRFGDPEAEAVLPMVRGDFAHYLLSAAKGELKRNLIHFAEGWSVCVILASGGYPVGSRSGDVISGLDEVAGSRVFHCGTRKGDHGFETNGGRVLAVVSQGATRDEARVKVYADADKIAFEGRQRRTDIAKLHFD